MLRNVLATVAAFVVGNLLIFAVQAIKGMIYPMPEGFDFNDAEAVKALVASMPIGAFLGIELSYIVGCAGAGAVVGKFAASRHMALAGVVGGLFTLAGFANMAMIPHPLWFAVLTTITYVPCALLGAKLVAPRT